MTSSEVREFIERRFPKDCNWTNGNCYWFAKILTERFPELSIWLFPVENHFMAGDEFGNVFYDWSEVRFRSGCEEIPVRWDSVKSLDELYYERLIKDCVD